MISYDPLWKTMKEKGITTYFLRNNGSANEIKGSSMSQLKHGGVIKTSTIDNLCKLLNCPVSDIIEFRPDPLPQDPTTPPR